jgi:hypothetical protein
MIDDIDPFFALIPAITIKYMIALVEMFTQGG